MSTKDLVNAIIVGDALEIENAFQATMAEKISARLDDYRQEVAQNMFATEEVELDEATEGEMKNRERMAQRADAERLAHGAMSRDEYNKKWKKGPYAQPSQRKRLPEDVELDEEQLDELSKGTLGSYIKKAGQHRVRLAGAERDLDDKDTALQRAKHGADDATYDALSKAQDTMRKQRYKVSDKSQQRAQGISRAINRLTKEEAEQILASEEFEQLDELSKTTLGNYIKKASGGVKGAMTHAYVAGGGTGASEEGKKKSFDIAQKRLKGVRTAVDKLTKEDVEQLVVTTVESALYALEEGRNVLDDQIVEAVSSDSKNRYEYTNGNKPRGHGNWMFSTVHPREHDVVKHKDQTVSVQGTFGDAAKKAQAHFKEKGHKGEIHVLT